MCADDFGFSPGTSEVIATLAHAGQIDAVSCMAVMPEWPDHARLLSGLEGRCEIGLHITLTDERPLAAMPRFASKRIMPNLHVLSRQALLRRAPLEEIAPEVERQFAAFTQGMRRPPDFVDAHQHVHHLPGLRKTVLQATAQNAPSAWVRSCSDGLTGLLARPFLGKAIGSAWHSRGFARHAGRFGLRTNTSFAGHYDFSAPFASVFPRFFDCSGDHHVIMTHPGADDRAGDSIGAARVREAEFLGAWR